jgi:hypothetical protein
MKYYEFIKTRGLNKLAKIITYATERQMADGKLWYVKLSTDELTDNFDEAWQDAKTWLGKEMDDEQ